MDEAGLGDSGYGSVVVRYIYRGVLHEETPLPVELVVDGAPKFLAEPRMFSSVEQGEIVLLKESELIDCESKNPGDVDGSDRVGGVIMLEDEGHVIMVI